MNSRALHRTIHSASVVLLAAGALVLGGARFWSAGVPRSGDRRGAVGSLWRELATAETTVAHLTPQPTLVLFTDYQCEACIAFHSILDEAVERAGVRARLVVRHFPLRQIHPVAELTALAVVCAEHQERLNQMHAALGRDRPILDSTQISDAARQVGVPDLGLWRDCLNSPGARTRVAGDVRLARLLDVRHLPALYMDGVELPYLPSGRAIVELLRSRDSISRR